MVDAVNPTCVIVMAIVIGLILRIDVGYAMETIPTTIQ
jgi:hypothetical protein